MTIYNQKEHEKWKAKSIDDPGCALVLLDFEYENRAFLQGCWKVEE